MTFIVSKPLATVISRCEGRIGYPFPAAVRTVTVIAVGVGIAPMIQTIRAILRDFGGDERVKDDLPPMQVVLLYGVVRPTPHTYMHFMHTCTY